jgi:hypothetical protein
MVFFKFSMTRQNPCAICNGKYEPCGPADIDASPSIQLHDVGVALYTSVGLPFLAEMDGKNVLDPGPQKEYNARKDVAQMRGKNRPCVLVQQPELKKRATGNSLPWICLMTTLDKTSPESIPTLFQDYAIPIFPNLGRPNVHTSHVHTSPEWSTDSGYIITIPVQTKDDRPWSMSRWKPSREQPRAGYRLELPAQFETLCQRKTAEFVKHIQAPSYVCKVLRQLLNVRPFTHQFR